MWSKGYSLLKSLCIVAQKSRSWQNASTTNIHIYLPQLSQQLVRPSSIVSNRTVEKNGSNLYFLEYWQDYIPSQWFTVHLCLLLWNTCTGLFPSLYWGSCFILVERFLPSDYELLILTYITIRVCFFFFPSWYLVI